MILSYHENSGELVERINLQRARARNENRKHTAMEESGHLRMLGAGGQILANLGVKKVVALGRRKKSSRIVRIRTGNRGICKNPRATSKLGECK